MPKNVENFEIRTLGRDDYAQAAEFFAFVHALHQANRPDIYRKTNAPLGEDEFFKMCDDPHEIMLCAVRDGKILGLARTVMRENAGDAVTLSRVRAVMEELAVLPQAQGMGIGTALLYASEAEAKRRGAESAASGASAAAGGLVSISWLAISKNSFASMARTCFTGTKSLAGS